MFLLKAAIRNFYFVLVLAPRMEKSSSVSTVLFLYRNRHQHSSHASWNPFFFWELFTDMLTEKQLLNRNETKRQAWRCALSIIRPRARVALPLSPLLLLLLQCLLKPVSGFLERGPLVLPLSQIALQLLLCFLQGCNSSWATQEARVSSVSSWPSSFILSRSLSGWPTFNCASSTTRLFSQLSTSGSRATLTLTPSLHHFKLRRFKQNIVFVALVFGSLLLQVLLIFSELQLLLWNSSINSACLPSRRAVSPLLSAPVGPFVSFPSVFRPAASVSRWNPLCPFSKPWPSTLCWRSAVHFSRSSRALCSCRISSEISLSLVCEACVHWLAAQTFLTYAAALVLCFLSCCFSMSVFEIKIYSFVFRADQVTLCLLWLTFHCSDALQQLAYNQRGAAWTERLPADVFLSPALLFVLLDKILNLKIQVLGSLFVTSSSFFCWVFLVFTIVAVKLLTHISLVPEYSICAIQTDFTITHSVLYCQE